MFPRNRILPYNPALRAKARELRKNGTLGEVLLWQAIRNKALGCEFHRQVPIGNYIVDFFCPEHMLAVEVDGSSHEHPASGVPDTTRQHRLEGMGVRFLRFTETEVRRKPGAAAEAIALWIEGQRVEKSAGDGTED